MTKFEEIGVSYQRDSDSVKEAIQRFRSSCTTCCYRGMRIDCDRCAIAQAHKETIACIGDGSEVKITEVAFLT